MNILCSSPLAKHPFVIPSLGLRIYSGEELCYFIYHNPALLDEHFINDELLRFVETELGLPGAAGRLARFAGSVEHQVQLMAVLREFAYYPEEQLRQFQKKLETEAKKQPFVRGMERGDALLEQKRYQAALRVYSQLLTQKEDPGYNEERCARILKQMALASCGMGLYARAVECLKQSYIQTPDLKTVKLAWQISRLGGLELEDHVIQPPSEELPAWEKEYQALEEQVRLKENTGELTMIRSLDSIRRREALNRYGRKQVEQYRENMQIAL